MSKRQSYDELDASIERIISDGGFVSSGNEGVDALARVASGLRGLPDPEFKARLAAEFRKEAQPDLISRMRSLPPFAWLMRQRAIAAAGGSCGLVAGACCVSGAVAHVTGLATAAAVTTYIHSTLPYFVGLSIVMLLACLAWSLRPQGFTPRTVAVTVRRHGIAFGSAYGVVFAASMALTMAMGLY
jgi:hypothetical protein